MEEAQHITDTIKAGSITKLPEQSLPEGWTYNIPSVEQAPPRHFDILMLAVTNMSAPAIAKQLGVGVETVRRVLNHAPYREYLWTVRSGVFERQVETYKKLHDAQPEIADALLDLIKTGKEATRLNAIKLYSTLFSLGTVKPLVEDTEDDDRLGDRYDTSEIDEIRSTLKK